MPETWVRSGTLLIGGADEIDLTNGEDWITVKGKTSERSKALHERLLALLNKGNAE